jgi:hypothetical protein
MRLESERYALLLDRDKSCDVGLCMEEEAMQAERQQGPPRRGNRWALSYDNTEKAVKHRMEARLCYSAIMPPSTAMVCPVTNDAASEQSHTTASATSSGVPRRPIGSKAVRRLSARA